MLGISADTIVFAEFGLPMKMISDASMSFTSDTFIQFCSQMNTEQAITSP